MILYNDENDDVKYDVDYINTNDDNKNDDTVNT